MVDKKYIIDDGKIYFDKIWVKNFRHSNKTICYGEHFLQTIKAPDTIEQDNHFMTKLSKADQNEAKSLINSRLKLIT